MKEITIYRVRRTFNDIKSQKGAFILYEAAVKVANKTGLCVFDGQGRLLYRPNQITKNAEKLFD